MICYKQWDTRYKYPHVGTYYQRASGMLRLWWHGVGLYSYSLGTWWHPDYACGFPTYVVLERD